MRKEKTQKNVFFLQLLNRLPTNLRLRSYSLSLSLSNYPPLSLSCICLGRVFIIMNRLSLLEIFLCFNYPCTIRLLFFIQTYSSHSHLLVVIPVQVVKQSFIQYTPDQGQLASHPGSSSQVDIYLVHTRLGSASFTSSRVQSCFYLSVISHQTTRG